MNAFQSTALSLGALILCATATSQVSRNVTLLKNLQPAGPGDEYSDVWGYLDPNTGKEYALLCSAIGTHVIDCSDPSNPVQRGMIATENPGLNNEWRDVKTFGSYAYVVSEAYPGIQIIDLSNPDNPTRVGLWGATKWPYAHNIAIDVDTGYAYVCGTFDGTHIVDLNQDPRNPREVYRESSPYIHDLSVADGYGYFAESSGNRLRIYDVTLLPGPLVLKSSPTMPGIGAAHATWPTRDGQYCIGANEKPGGPVSFWDVSDKRLPWMVATYQPNPTTAPFAIAHNVYVEDRIAHITYYTEGYRVLDLTDPSGPVEVGYYDTWTGPSMGYHGAWGAYHTMPSGVVFVSDIEAGLWLFKPKANPVKYGQASAGSAGRAPEIRNFGASYLNNQRFRVSAENAPPSRPGALLLGAVGPALPFEGITLHVALSSPAPLAISLASDAQGAVSVPVPIPDDQLLNGAVLSAQFIFADSLTSVDLSATRGMQFELFDL